MNLVNLIIAILTAPFTIIGNSIPGAMGMANAGLQAANLEYQRLRSEAENMAIAIGLGFVLIFSGMILIALFAAFSETLDAWLTLFIVLLQAAYLGIFVSGKYSMLVMRIGFWHGAGSGAARHLKNVKLPKFNPRDSSSEPSIPSAPDKLNLSEILKSLETNEKKGIVDGLTYALATIFVTLANAMYSGVHTLGALASKVEGGALKSGAKITDMYKALGLGSLEVSKELGLTGAEAMGSGAHMAVKYALNFNRGIWSGFTFLMFIEAFLIAFPFERLGDSSIVPRVLLFSLVIGVGVLSWSMKTSYGKKAIIYCSIGMVVFSAIAAGFPLERKATAGISSKYASYPTDWLLEAGTRVWDHYANPTPPPPLVVQMTTGPTGPATTLTFADEIEVQVFADDSSWQSTGIYLSQGDKFMLEIVGGDQVQISRLRNGDVGPKGHKKKYLENALIDGLKKGELIVSIGGRDPHRVNWKCVRNPGDSECSVWRALTEASLAGEIQFMIADKDYDDNRGSFDVTIRK